MLPMTGKLAAFVTTSLSDRDLEPTGKGGFYLGT